MTRAKKLNKAERFRVAMVVAGPLASPRGSQVLVRALVAGLRNRGHVVHVVTHSDHEDSLVKRHVASDFMVFAFARRLLADIRLMRQLYCLVKSHPMHLIHAHNYEAHLVSLPVRWLTGVPVVYHAHNVLADELPWYARSRAGRAVARVVAALLDHILPSLADHVVALTDRQRTFLADRGVAASRLSTIEPSVEVADLDGAGSQTHDEGEDEAAASLAGRFVLMYAGNLDAYQNIDLLFAGLALFRARVKDAVLVLLLDERDVRPSVQLLLAKQPNVVVIVARSSAARMRWLSRGDILVCPRTSWSGFPIKLINYMLSGRAIVASDGSARVIQAGITGRLFRRDQAESLSDELFHLYGDSDLRVALGANARVAALRFIDLGAVSEKVECVYAKVREVTREPENTGSAIIKGLIGFPRDRISSGVARRATTG